MHQLEARLLKKQGVQAKVQGGLTKHDPLRQAGTPGIAVKPEVYDNSADVAMVKKVCADMVGLVGIREGVVP